MEENLTPLAREVRELKYYKTFKSTTLLRVEMKKVQKTTHKRALN